MDACTVGTGCNYDQFFLWSGTKGYLSEFDTFEALKEGESSLPPSLLEIVGATLPPAFDIGGATETLPPAFEIGTITEDEDEIHLPEFYETLLFEVGDGGKLDLKQNTMKYFNDNETEKIARYILGYMSAYDMHEGDVSFIWDPFPGSKEDKID